MRGILDATTGAVTGAVRKVSGVFSSSHPEPTSPLTNAENVGAPIVATTADDLGKNNSPIVPEEEIFGSFHSAPNADEVLQPAPAASTNVTAKSPHTVLEIARTESDANSQQDEQFEFEEGKEIEEDEEIVQEKPAPKYTAGEISMRNADNNNTEIFPSEEQQLSGAPRPAPKPATVEVEIDRGNSEYTNNSRRGSELKTVDSNRANHPCHHDGSLERARETNILLETAGLNCFKKFFLAITQCIPAPIRNHPVISVYVVFCALAITLTELASRGLLGDKLATAAGNANNAIPNNQLVGKENALTVLEAIGFGLLPVIAWLFNYSRRCDNDISFKQRHDEDKTPYSQRRLREAQQRNRTGFYTQVPTEDPDANRDHVATPNTR